MLSQQFRPSLGKSCHSGSAVFAEAKPGSRAALALAPPKRRERLFAQFPPAALFAVISRAACRCQFRSASASGTALANGRRWRALGGP